MSAEGPMTSVFNITFVANDGSARLEPDHRLVEITLGNFVERVPSYVGYWNESQYEQHWVAAVEHIAANERSALITSLHDPSVSNFVRWWPCYRVGESVCFQEQILFLDQLSEAFVPLEWFRFVPERATVTDEGEKISEWVVPMSAVLAFAQAKRGP